MNTLLYICFHVWWLLEICCVLASPNAKAEPEAHHTDYGIPKYYEYRYGDAVYTPSVYDDLYITPPISYGQDSYKAKDNVFHTYQSNSYDHKGYPPKGFVSVRYGQNGYGHNSYVHKTIGYDHKGYSSLHSSSYGSPGYVPYNNHGGYVHKGFEHKEAFTEKGYGLGDYGHNVKSYGIDHNGYNGLTNVLTYDKVYKPYGHGNIIFGFAHQNLGLSAHLPAAYKVNESPYGDHLRYGYGRNILSPYSNSYLRR